MVFTINGTWNRLKLLWLEICKSQYDKGFLWLFDVFSLSLPFFHVPPVKCHSFISPVVRIPAFQSGTKLSPGGGGTFVAGESIKKVDPA